MEHITDHDFIQTYQTDTLVSIAFAFFGWTAWTFTAIFDRSRLLLLFPMTFIRLVIRLVVAVIASIVMRHFLADDQTDHFLPLPVLAFVIGMFPERALSFLTNKFDEFVRANQRSEDFPLELIQGVNPELTFRFQEIGIVDAESLAQSNPFSIFDASAFPMTEIVDWIAQAQMLLILQEDNYKKIQRENYRNIFDLARLLKSPGGEDQFISLTGLSLPTGCRLSCIEASADYQRLLRVYVALGSAAPRCLFASVFRQKLTLHSLARKHRIYR